jgi:general secretion pathway protein B
MSLILEALKKSEAKRRLGEAPDLATPFAATAPRRGLLPFILIAIVAAAGAGWWLLDKPSASDKPAATSTPQAKPTLTTNPPPTRTVAAESPRPPAPSAPAPNAQIAAEHAASRPTAPAAESKGPSPFIAVPEPGKPMPSLGSRRTSPPTADVSMAGKRLPPQPAAAAALDSAPKPKTLTAAATAPPQSTRTMAPAAGQKILPKAPEPKAPDTPPATTEVVGDKNVALAAKSAAEKPAAPVPPPASASAQPYYELPFSVRKDLPPLRLNMHVYAADATQRFVILNNSRMAEGDSQDDLALREIRPDGVVLEFRGQRFFYPRDGF